MTTAEILQDFQQQHSALGRQVDAADVEEFDRQHRAFWARCDEALINRKALLEGQPVLTSEEEAELIELQRRTYYV